MHVTLSLQISSSLLRLLFHLTLWSFKAAVTDKSHAPPAAAASDTASVPDAAAASSEVAAKQRLIALFKQVIGGERTRAQERPGQGGGGESREEEVGRREEEGDAAEARTERFESLLRTEEQRELMAEVSVSKFSSQIHAAILYPSFHLNSEKQRELMAEVSALAEHTLRCIESRGDGGQWRFSLRLKGNTVV